MKNKFLLLPIVSILLLTSCTENYSNGERIGLVTKFSQSGLIFKSWEGHLNLTQTGMNSSEPFDFSIGNDNEPAELVNQIDSAAQHGYKVKLTYHEVFGFNWFGNRGDTDHFVTACEILDKTPAHTALNGAAGPTPQVQTSTSSVLLSTLGTKQNPLYIVIVNDASKDSIFITK